MEGKNKTLQTNRKDLSVLILCGGKGERLKPLTDILPKPLVKIKGKPMLNYLIAYFERHGFRRFVVAVGYKPEKIVRYLKQEHKNLNIEIVDSGDVDILERMKDASEVIPGDFIMCYGDTLADVDLKKLIRFHKAHQGKVSMTSYPLESQFGILEMRRSGKVKSFKEKPVLDKWINIGYYYFSRNIVNEMRKHHRLVDFLHALIRKGELYSFKHTGVHITVNTLKELNEAEKNIGMFEQTLGGKTRGKTT